MSYPRWTDYTGDVLEIRAGALPDHSDAAVIDLDPDGGGTPFFIAAHELRGIVAALCDAAGQPAPEMPLIPDPEELNRLAKLIHYAINGTVGSTSLADQYAGVLLAHGVRLPEVPR